MPDEHGVVHRHDHHFLDADDGRQRPVGADVRVAHVIDLDRAFGDIAGAVGIALFSTLLTNATNAKVLEVGAYTIINDASYTSVVATLAILKAQILAYREVEMRQLEASR